MPKARGKGKRPVSNASEACSSAYGNPYHRNWVPHNDNVSKGMKSKVKQTSEEASVAASTSGLYRSEHLHEDRTLHNRNWKFKTPNKSSSQCQRGRVHDKNRSHQNINYSSFRHSYQRYGRSSYKKNQHTTENKSQNNSSSTCDIPGFYYDPEKERYFKILPGQNNVNVTTRESIAKKTAEDKRLKDLEKKVNVSNVISSRKCKFKSTTNYKLNNFVDIIFGKHQGDLGKNVIESVAIKSQVEKLKLTKTRKVFENPFGTYENLDHMLMMDTSPDFCDILGLWSIKDTFVNRIQLLHVDIKKKQFPGERREVGLSLDVNPCGNVILQSLNKITHVCWAPSLENPSRKYILYTTTCYTGHSPSLALFRNLEPVRREDFRATDFCLGNEATWTCAWNPYEHKFSVGAEKHGLLLDVESRKLWEIFSNKSDVLAQVFTDYGQSLLSGTRKGQILTHDLRSRSTHPVQTLNHHSPISSLKLLNDDLYLLASDFAGKVNLWDLRMRRVIQEFKGHFNQYSKLPIHVDESENLLYLAGEDCYTRFWNLKTGALITSLPPPCPASRDSIPAVLYSQTWGGQWGQAGLVAGMKDKLHFFDNSQEWT